MIGLDTNVLVRYLTQDDETQSREAERLVDGLTDEAPGFVSIAVLCELIWVLGRAYRVPREEILTIVEGLLSSKELRVEESAVVHRSIRAARGTAIGFVDALIAELNVEAGCTETVTFDRGAAELPSMRLLTE